MHLPLDELEELLLHITQSRIEELLVLAQLGLVLGILQHVELDLKQPCRQHSSLCPLLVEHVLAIVSSREGMSFRPSIVLFQAEQQILLKSCIRKFAS